MACGRAPQNEFSILYTVVPCCVSPKNCYKNWQAGRGLAHESNNFVQK